MAAAGSGLGSVDFIVIDDSTDLVAFAQGVAQFLAVESCGQCLPCKHDGLGIGRLLADVCPYQAVMATSPNSNGALPR